MRTDPCFARLTGAGHAGRATAPLRPTQRLLHLADRLPGYGQIVDMRDLGITVGSLEKPPKPVLNGYNFRTPANLDRAATTDAAYAGRYAGLYLNQPLQRHKSDVPYLFISDQPEEIRDDRLRDDGTHGAVGIYAMAPFPSDASVRVLMDHTNGTKKRLRLVLIWIPYGEGAFMVSQRGEGVNKDSVAAAHEAFVQARRVPVEPRHTLHVHEGIAVTDLLLAPQQDAVVHLCFASTVSGILTAAVIPPDAPLPLSVEALRKMPALHSIVWREEAERLKRFIDPSVQPHRYARILNSFQHARGKFIAPDRVARVSYAVGSWRESAAPVRAYSLFESIPGYDATPGTVDPNDPMRTVAFVDNRGKYGGVEELRIAIRRLPPHCHHAALLVLNPNGTYGGRHYVTDGHTIERDTWFLPPRAVKPKPKPWEIEDKIKPVDEVGPEDDNAPKRGITADATSFPRSDASVVPGEVLPLLGNDKAALLWRGSVEPGEVLRMWTEPMANTSVYLWYLLVPIPDAGPVPTTRRGH